MKNAIVMKKLVLLACATLAPGAATLADHSVVTRTETVKYSRSAAATAEGAVKLYGELRSAAARACRDAGMPMAYGDSVDDCRDAALSRAIADVQIDALTAVYMQDTGSRAKPGMVAVAKR